MIIFDSRKNTVSNWADEKWVTQKIQHILEMITENEKINLQVCIYIRGELFPFEF